MIVCLLTVTVLHIFHKSTFQTRLQLSGSSIWKVNLSRKEPNLEFWCNVTLNNCMSLSNLPKHTGKFLHVLKEKLVTLVTATEVLALVWNEIPQLVCQFSVVPYQQFNTLASGWFWWFLQKKQQFSVALPKP